MKAARIPGVFMERKITWSIALSFYCNEVTAEHILPTRAYQPCEMNVLYDCGITRGNFLLAIHFAAKINRAICSLVCNIKVFRNIVNWRRKVESKSRSDAPAALS